jgi:CPA2 family monovalent cation:H+ antiporter-2
MENSHLISDMGWMMAVAAAVAILFQRLKIPVIIGYLLVGLFLGPYSFFESPIHDIGNIKDLGELGVLFLMFFIGLEFDFDKLGKVMGPALLALLCQTTVMMFLGIQAGLFLEWTSVESLFLGGILSISSSMVTVKLIRDRGELKRPYAENAVGILILEDILAIVLLVLLSGVAVSGHFSWDAAGRVTFLIGAFFVVVFVVGKLIAPKIIEMLRRFGTGETFILFSIGLILGVSILAETFEFSLALGGFLAGAILSKSSVSEEIEKLTTPFRDFFSAMFFVAAGMQFDPAVLFRNWEIIVGLTSFVVVGKFLTCWFGLVLAGQKPETATRASLAKAQIGEFGFVIAALGANLNVTNPQLKAVTAGVALLSIALTPALNRYASGLNQIAARKGPGFIQEWIKVYLNWLEAVRCAIHAKGFLRIAVRPCSRLIIGFFLMNGILITVSFFLRDITLPEHLDGWLVWFQQGAWLVVAVVCIPILIDAVRNGKVLITLFLELATSKTGQGSSATRFFRDLAEWVWLAVVMLFFGMAFLAASARFFPTGLTLAIFCIVCVILALLFWRKLLVMHNRLEYAVVSSMSEQNRTMVRESMEKAIFDVSEHDPWQVEMEEIVIGVHSRVSGERIRDLDLRKKTGAIIVALERGGVVHYNLSPDLPFSPHDKVHLMGEKEQLRSAVKFFSERRDETKPSRSAGRVFEKVIVGPTSDLIGVSLRESNLRAKFGITIAGIQRGESRIIGPSVDEVFHAGDLLLVWGSDSAILSFKESLVEL